jgi:hypothetical protein
MHSDCFRVQQRLKSWAAVIVCHEELEDLGSAVSVQMHSGQHFTHCNQVY